MGEIFARLRERQEMDGGLAVEFSTPLFAEEVRDRLYGFRDQDLLIVGH